MAIIDITVIPIGTETASVSQYVADLQRILAAHEDQGTISYTLTPMSTLIEGELSVLLGIVQELHEAPFAAGIDRVATNIRIDDRRDRPSHTMKQKLEAVERHLNKKS